MSQNQIQLEISISILNYKIRPMKKISHIFYSATYTIILSTLCFTSSSCSNDADADPPQEVSPPETSSSACVDRYATNFDENATYADNSCQYLPVACSTCDYILETDVTTLDNAQLKLPPGAVIGIKGGQRKTIDIKNFHGEANLPYIFTNCDGIAILDLSSKPEAIRIRNSSFIRLTGTGTPNATYGIEIKDGSHGVRAYQKVSDLEIDHLSITGVGVGIWVVTRPVCDGSANRGNYIQKNTKIHHNHVYDVHGEGMYIGGSKWEVGFSNEACPGEKLYQADLTGVRVFNNSVENTGWDGIQVGGAIEDCEIYNNTIKNYGLLNAGPHQAGLMINPGTTGKIYSNRIHGGTGNALHVLGFDNLIYSNTISNCQMNAIHVGDRNPLPNKSYRILHNTIFNTKGNALRFNTTKSVNNIFYNNFIANTTQKTFSISDEKLITFANNSITDALEDYPFEDISKNNLTPTLESSLLDSAKTYTRDPIPVDALMRKRSVGAHADIGAFENQQEDD
jgi:hypothetical protein